MSVLLGYARVSKGDDQSNALQANALGIGGWRPLLLRARLSLRCAIARRSRVHQLKKIRTWGLLVDCFVRTKDTFLGGMR